MFNLPKILQNISLKHIFIAIVCVSIVGFLYYAFIYEGFDKDACALTARGVDASRRTMDELDKTVGESSRDQLNLDINYRDMQTRDIILGEDSKAWCDGLTKEEIQKLIDEGQVPTDDKFWLFGNTSVMDAEEQADKDSGVVPYSCPRTSAMYTESLLE